MRAAPKKWLSWMRVETLATGTEASPGTLRGYLVLCIATT